MILHLGFDCVRLLWARLTKVVFFANESIGKAFMIKSGVGKNKRGKYSGNFLPMLVDSGCSEMLSTLNPSQLSNFVSNNLTISTAGSQFLHSLGSGSYGPLNSVHAVPGLQENLFSVFKCCQEGKVVVFTVDTVNVFESSKLIMSAQDIPIISGFQRDGLYHVEIPNDPRTLPSLSAYLASSKPINKFTLWHERMDHCSDAKLIRMKNKDTVLGLDWTQEDVKLHKQKICEACAIGKMHMKPIHRKQKSEVSKSYKAGELIFADVFFSNVKSKGGNTCCLLLVDAHSKKLWPKFMKNKGEALEYFDIWRQEMLVEGLVIGGVAPLNEIKTSSTFRSDNGGEFCSNEFKAYLREHGIRKETSPPYAHVSIVERNIQTVKESARTSVIAAKVELTNAARVMSKNRFSDPFVFWCEAVNTTIDHLNAMPSGQSKNCSRDEIFSGDGTDRVKSNLSHFRTFGCRTFAKVSDELRKCWDEKGYEGVFLGYDKVCPGSWKIFKLDTAQFVNTMNVDFDENLQAKEVKLMLDLQNYAKGIETSPNVFYSDTASDESIRVSSHDLENLRGIFESPEGSQVLITPEELATVRKYVSDVQVAAVVSDKAARNVSVFDENNAPEVPRRSERSNKSSVDMSSFRLQDPTGKRGQGRRAAANFVNISVPKTQRQALSEDNPYHAKWAESIRAENESLEKTSALTIMELPPGVRTLGLKWVFKVKENEDGSVERFKARCTILGNLQIEGLDYDETFSPVVRYKTVRAILAIAAAKGYLLHNMDVDTAFLYGSMEGEQDVYIEVPQGYNVPADLANSGKPLCAKVNVGIYGLKQAPRLWNQTIHAFMTSKGFKRCDSDPCLYTKSVDGEEILVAIFVDDLIIAGSNIDIIQSFKDDISAQFNMKDLGELSFILGMSVRRDMDAGTITLFQSKYINDILIRFGMDGCTPLSLPMDPGCKMSREMSPKTQEEFDESEKVSLL